MINPEVNIRVFLFKSIWSYWSKSLCIDHFIRFDGCAFWYLTWCDRFCAALSPWPPVGCGSRLGTPYSPVSWVPTPGVLPYDDYECIPLIKTDKCHQFVHKYVCIYVNTLKWGCSLQPSAVAFVSIFIESLCSNIQMVEIHIFLDGFSERSDR